MTAPRRVPLLLVSLACAACATAPGQLTVNGRSPAPAGVQTAPSGGTTPATPASAAPAVVQLPGQAAAFLAVAPGVPFTGELLISDRGNHRLLLVGADGSVSWEFPSPGRTLPVTFGAPDDAFYTQDGRTVIANAEGSQTVTAVDVATSTVLWQVGHNGVRGTAPGYFSEPDDAVPSADGSIWVADIRNCRLVHLGSGGAWLGTIGGGGCRHDPPGSLDLPNGAFPAPDGSRVITEIGGSWVTWLNPDGTVRWSTRSPALYPSDAVPYPDGSVLLTDYSYPGAVYRIDSSGKVVWSYRPRGASSLDHPSIALPLAANRVAVCDDWGNKVLIVDPTTNTVVWTFTGQGSTRLSLPDGLDYLPVG